MDPQYSWNSVNVDDIQLRIGVLASMLLDTVPTEEVIPIEAMGRGLPCGPMGVCEHPVHSSFHWSEAGKLACGS